MGPLLTFFGITTFLLLQVFSASAAESQRVRVGVFEHPPVVAYEGLSRPQGLYPQLMEAIAAEQNWQIEYVAGTWAEGLERLKRAEIDLMTSIAFVEERTAYADYSKVGVHLMWGELSYLKGPDIKSVFDLSGRQIGILKGGVNGLALRKLCSSFEVSCQFQEFPSYDEVFDAVADGRIEVGVSNNVYAQWQRHHANLKRAGWVFNPTSLLFAAPKNHKPELLSAIDSTLERWKKEADSPYAVAIDRWFGVRKPIFVTPAWLWPFVAGTLFFVLLLLIRYGWLHLRVRRQASDIDKEQHARQDAELRERVSQERLSQAAELAGIGIWELDPLGGPLIANAQCYALHGLSEAADIQLEALLKRSLSEGKADQLISAISREHDGAKSDIFTHQVPLPDGNIRFLYSSKTSLIDENGEPKRIIGVTLDVTELTLMSQQLEQGRKQLYQSDKMASLGVLAAGVGHEINTPIGYVGANLRTLRDYLADITELLGSYIQLGNQQSDLAFTALKGRAEELDIAMTLADIDDLISESLEGADRVKGIAQDIKDFSRPADKEQVLTDLHQGLNSTLNILHNEFKNRIEVDRQLDPSLPLVSCVAAQINQVFLNLLINAGQAISGRGVISIRSGHDAAEVWIEIADTGQGIEQSALDHIFDPFYTTKPVGQGTGLGLSLVHGIVTQHRGRIAVQSTLAVGTTFRLTLPLPMDQQIAS